MVKYLKVLVLTSYFNCQNTTLHKKWNRNYHKIIRIFLGTKINVIMLKYAWKEWCIEWTNEKVHEGKMDW